MSDGEYSDASDDGDDGAYDQRPRGASTSTEYRISNVLQVSRATTYTAQALYDQIYLEDINLEPDYQRAVVWPVDKKIGLVNSIFRNFYIPPVIFAVKSLDDGSEKRTCIDGKQRLTSIREFMDGNIPYRDSMTNEKFWYKDNEGGNRRPLLPERYRRLFANKQIVCVEYQGISDTDEREIFQRVQLGMALTPAEKLQVIPGPRPAFIRELRDTYLDAEDGLGGDALHWDQSRGADFRCLAQVVYTLEHYSPTLKNFGTIRGIEKWLADPAPPAPALRARAHSTLALFRALVHDPDPAARAAFAAPRKVAPVEFVGIAALLAALAGRPHAQLVAAVGEMRAAVRRAHADVRLNDRVMRTHLDFIRAHGGGGGGGGGAGGGGGGAPGGKRKREDDGADAGAGADDGDAASASASTPAPRARRSTATPVPAPRAARFGSANALLLPPKPDPGAGPSSAGPSSAPFSAGPSAAAAAASTVAGAPSPAIPASLPLHAPAPVARAAKEPPPPPRVSPLPLPPRPAPDPRAGASLPSPGAAFSFQSNAGILAAVPMAQPGPGPGAGAGGPWAGQGQGQGQGREQGDGQGQGRRAG